MALAAMQALSVRTHVADWRNAIRRLPMTGETTARVVRRAGAVAVKTADAHSAGTVQSDTMTESAGIPDIAGCVVERGARISGPVVWVGIIDPVAGFTTGPAGAVDPDIEAGIAPRPAGLAMTVLADRQVGLGIRTVDRSVQVSAIQRVRCLAGTFRVTAATVETGRETTWRSRAAKQVGSMTIGAGGESIEGRKAAMVDIRIGPVSRMNNKWWGGIKDVTGIAADRRSISFQVTAVTDDAIGEAGYCQRGRRMCCDPGGLMGLVVRRRTGIAIAATGHGERNEKQK